MEFKEFVKQYIKDKSISPESIAIEIRDKFFKKTGKYYCWKKFLSSAKIIYLSVYGSWLDKKPN